VGDRRRIRVAVLFGGRSSEHRVSCVSAQHVVTAMDAEKYEVIPIAIGLDGRWLLPDASRKVLEGGVLEIPEGGFAAEGEPIAVVPDPGGTEIVPIDTTGGVESFGLPDVVFPVLHGPYGEDGTMQGFLELAGIPFVGSGVLGSALGMDKEKMKVLFSAEGLPIPRFYVIKDHQWEIGRDLLIEEIETLGYPVFTKPANLGSSVGISRSIDTASLIRGIESAFEYDRKAIVEEAVPGRELEVGVLGNETPEVSVVGEIVPGREFYDYADKYLEDSARIIVPANLPTPVTDLVRNYALRAFRAIDAAGMARVDFFYEDGGRGVVVNEINTIPGFTTISMFPKLWEASGVSYSQLIDRLIELALDRHRKKPNPKTLLPPGEL
jgi:D-alanine-D-alanine ligase